MKNGRATSSLSQTTSTLEDQIPSGTNPDKAVSNYASRFSIPKPPLPHYTAMPRLWILALLCVVCTWGVQASARNMLLSELPSAQTASQVRFRHAAALTNCIYHDVSAFQRLRPKMRYACVFFCHSIKISSNPNQRAGAQRLLFVPCMKYIWCRVMCSASAVGVLYRCVYCIYIESLSSLRVVLFVYTLAVDQTSLRHRLQAPADRYRHLQRQGDRLILLEGHTNRHPQLVQP